jgi:hypothetical protein
MSIFDTYGLSPSFRAEHRLLDHGSDLASSGVEIADAIDLLAPRPCGLPLIRLGGAMDGGYLIPDDLNDIDACFSPGTNNFKRFEDELYQRWGIRSFMCDFSSDIEHFVTPLIEGAQFFEKKWLDVYGGEDALDLNTWVAANAAPGRDLILQMDIEGAEYRNLIHATAETLIRFRIIVLEIHDLQNLRRHDYLYGVFRAALDKLNKTHVSVHANNACGEVQFFPGLAAPMAVEVTFLRRDRVKSYEQVITMPNRLDQLNVHREAPIGLAGPWSRYADATGSRLAALEQSVNWLAARVRSLNEYNHFLTRNFSPRSENVALKAAVSQSSLSPYSTADGARGGANGKRTGGFGFHTDTEDGPWWLADLGRSHRLEACLVFNRMDGASVRARTLQVWTSLDNATWKLAYAHDGRPIFGGIYEHDGMPPLLVDLRGTSARYVKLQLAENTALHLDEIEIYGHEDA